MKNSGYFTIYNLDILNNFKFFENCQKKNEENMDDYNEVNKVYSKYFKSDPPAREAVEVSKLPKNVNIEISTIAVK